MRLLLIMNCLSMDLQTCNLNNSGMWLIKSLFFKNLESLLVESRNPKMEPFVVKVGNTNLETSILSTITFIKYVGLGIQEWTK